MPKAEVACAMNEWETPYCLGRATIEAVADEGQLALESGHAFIAASDLFKQNPYRRIAELEAQNKRCVALAETSD